MPTHNDSQDGAKRAEVNASLSQSLDALLDLLAREVARRLPRQAAQKAAAAHAGDTENGCEIEPPTITVNITRDRHKKPISTPRSVADTP